MLLIHCTNEKEWEFMKVLADRLDDVDACVKRENGKIVPKTICALAYVKTSNSDFIKKDDITFLPDTTPKTSHGQKLGWNNKPGLKGDTHAWIGASPNNRNHKHAEVRILEQLPGMGKEMRKKGKVDSVYLYTKSSPCCRINDENNKTPVGDGFSGYFKCVEESCAISLARFKNTNDIDNLYVSWSDAYVKKTSKTENAAAASPSNNNLPVGSIFYYRNFFFSMREMMSKDVIILPLTGKDEWFQLELEQCLNADSNYLDMVKKVVGGAKKKWLQANNKFL